MPTVRFGGGVWKHQDDVRADLQRRLDESDAKLYEATAEVNRVHAQCVLLLRDKNELVASLRDAETQRRHHAAELHAAKQNVSELMTLLTQANEARTRLEKERSSVTTRWHHAREHEAQTSADAERLRLQCAEDDHELQRLRDLLYAVQEENACQQEEITRQQRRLAVAIHSNDAKNRQIVALVRERDGFAHKLAQYRSRSVETKSVTARLPAPPSPLKNLGHNAIEDSCTNVTWTEIAPARKAKPSISNDTNVIEFEREKQRLRECAQQAKTRLEHERAQNATLLQRISALEKSQHELLVRYREAAKARQRRVHQGGPSIVLDSDTSTVGADNTVEAA